MQLTLIFNEILLKQLIKKLHFNTYYNYNL